MSKSEEQRFARIERNLEQATRSMAITAAVNAETAHLAKQNEQAIRRLIETVQAFVRGQANGKH